MKLKELINNENFLSKYGDYEIVRDTYTTVRKNDKSQLVFDVQKPKPKSVWDLEGGDRYFVLYHDGDIAEYKWAGDTSLAESYRDQGNVFSTKEEALKDVERRAVETLLLKHGGRRWFKCDITNWSIRYNHTQSSFEYGYASVTQYPSCIYFDTEEQAQKAVQEIGEERIKKALFEVR